MDNYIEIGDDTIITAKAGITKSFPGKNILIGIPAMTRKDFLKQMKITKKAEELVSKFKEYESLFKGKV